MFRPSSTLTLAFASSCAISRASLPPPALALDAHASLHLPPKIALQPVHIDRRRGGTFAGYSRRRDRLGRGGSFGRAICERHRRHRSRHLALLREIRSGGRPAARALRVLMPDKRVLSVQARLRPDSRSLNSFQ